MNTHEFWPLFIGTHLNPWNRRFHAFGVIVMFTFFAVFATTGRWGFLLAGFAGYAPSWIGHFLFEGNVPVTIKNPLLSALCDLKMMGMMASGELSAELFRLFGSRSPTPGTPCRVSLENEVAYQEALRYKIGAEIPSHPFTDYWDIFLLKHQNAVNVWVHVLAMLYLYGLLAYVALSGRYSLLIALPLSQLAGLISHALVERTHIDFQDAIFSPRAFFSLNRMMVLVLTSRYWTELERVQQDLRRFQARDKNARPNVIPINRRTYSAE